MTIDSSITGVHGMFAKIHVASICLEDLLQERHAMESSQNEKNISLKNLSCC